MNFGGNNYSGSRNPFHQFTSSTTPTGSPFQHFAPVTAPTGGNPFQQFTNTTTTQGNPFQQFTNTTTTQGNSSFQKFPSTTTTQGNPFQQFATTTTTKQMTGSNNPFHGFVTGSGTSSPTNGSWNSSQASSGSSNISQNNSWGKVGNHNGGGGCVTGITKSSAVADVSARPIHEQTSGQPDSSVQDALAAELEKRRQSEKQLIEEVRALREIIAHLAFADGLRYKVNLSIHGLALLPPGVESPPISTSSPLHAEAKRLFRQGGTFDPVTARFQPVRGFTLQHVTLVNPEFINSFRERILRLAQLRKDSPKEFDPARRTLTHPDQFQLVEMLRVLFLPRAAGTPLAEPNLVNVFHGTKPERVASVIKGIARVATTDPGFFGTGCYASNSIEYTARQYSTPRQSDGCRPVVWCVGVAGNAYPVTVNDIDPQRKDRHTKYLGKGLAPGADAHIAPVSSKNAYKVVPVAEMEFLEFVFANDSALLPIAVLWVK